MAKSGLCRIDAVFTVCAIFTYEIAVHEKNRGHTEKNSPVIMVQVCRGFSHFHTGNGFQ